MKIYYVYILKCADDTYYTGITSNIDKRYAQHQSSYYEDSCTSKRLPVDLVFYAEFSMPGIAIEKEKQIKRWSKAKKEALINDKFEDLPNLAKKKFKK